MAQASFDGPMSGLKPIKPKVSKLSKVAHVQRACVRKGSIKLEYQLEVKPDSS